MKNAKIRSSKEKEVLRELSEGVRQQPNTFELAYELPR